MKILFISFYDPITSSGPGNHLRFLSDALSVLGCEVHILLPGSKTRCVKINNVFMHYIKSKSITRGFLFSLLSVGWANKIIKAYRIDIVHGESPSTFGYALLSKNKIPFVVTLHGTSFGELTSFLNVPFNCITPGMIKDALILQPLSAFLTAIEYRFADKNLAVSMNIAQEAKGYYHIKSRKITAISNGIDPSTVIINTENQNNDFIILLVGRLVWRKGIKYLIEALPAVLVIYPNTKLIIVGDGEQRQYLNKLVISIGVQRSVKFMENIPAPELISLYNSATIYVQPSLYEPLGIAIMEAMSYCKPVIASNVGGIPELISDGHEGLLVEPYNSKQLSDAIINLLSNAALRKKYGLNGREKINNSFTWKQIAEKTLQLYTDLIEKRVLHPN